MKKIPLEQAHEILKNCAGVVVEGTITRPSVWKIEDSDENEFLYIDWQEDQGLVYSVKFCEGENQEVPVIGSVMYLTDNEGDVCEVTVLEQSNLEE